MHKMMTVFTLFILITLAACTKDNYTNAVVVKDCTGSYLRIDDKDYHICNDDVVEAYEDETEVRASFKRIEECPVRRSVCEMYHKNEGWIFVTTIR